jgi:hypothetical protein
MHSQRPDTQAMVTQIEPLTAPVEDGFHTVMVLVVVE